MTLIACPHCGHEMDSAAACPVCEFHVPPPAPSPRVAAASTSPAPGGWFVRGWISGRLPVLLAAVACGVGAWLPMLSLTRVGQPVRWTPVTALQMMQGQGPFGADVKSTVAVFVPASAFALLSFLWSRTTGKTMRASRPLVFVVSLLPLVTVVVRALTLAHRNQVQYRFAPGAAALVVSTVLGVWGAFTFGRGVPDPAPGRPHPDDVDP